MACPYPFCLGKVANISVLYLCDDRYGQPGYFILLPPHYRVTRARGGEIEGYIKEFWGREQ